MELARRNPAWNQFAGVPEWRRGVILFNRRAIGIDDLSYVKQFMELSEHTLDAAKFCSLLPRVYGGASTSPYLPK